MNKKIKAYVTRAKKDGYYNIYIDIRGFKCLVKPMFLTGKQWALLSNNIEELMEEENND